MVRWPVPQARFDHAQAGWKLEGKHAGLKCAVCHNTKYLDPQDRAVLKRRDLNASFTGLSASCAACHKDIHTGQLGANCTKCHVQDNWKATPGFSHDQTKYPLTGVHARVECQKCHHSARSQPGGPVLYKNFVFFENCVSCHADPHGGAFAGGCQKCHTTGGWKQLSGSARFDHSQTRFALLGKHAAAACTACHKSNNFKAPVPFARCLDCHQDPHGGQFAKRADGGDCGGCHDERSFKPARFTVEDHAKSAYPLLGKHTAVECGRCHIPKGKDTQYRVAFASCKDCHRDAHAGQFAAAPYQDRCEKCHVVEGFRPSTYTLAAHNQMRFALNGAHAAVPCSGCHQPKGRDTNFHPASGNCADCHASPHGKLSVGLTCEGCHTSASWKQVTVFDHSRTTFALLGRHRTVSCLDCHKPDVGGSVRTVSFPGTPQECGGCHADVHDGQFHAAGQATGCQNCHTTANWKPTAFDHSRHSTFKLDGAHEKVPCGMCHDQRRVVAGRTVIVYKGTPRECSRCHR